MSAPEVEVEMSAPEVEVVMSATVYKWFWPEYPPSEA
jgi:hypothetical protein